MNIFFEWKKKIHYHHNHRGCIPGIYGGKMSVWSLLRSVPLYKTLTPFYTKRTSLLCSHHLSFSLASPSFFPQLQCHLIEQFEHSLDYRPSLTHKHQERIVKSLNYITVEMDGAVEDEAEQALTLDEYLEEVEERELEADLVLGGDDGKECTYSKGYMKRQAIFSCLTCTPDGNAGVCTACSLSCHDGHQIVELWTKRNFRCDCGNSKFGEFYCKIFPNKDVENVENSYNHNFKGSYCTCGRPYPDPDAEEQVEMIQCCLCEDWFHEEHLGLESSAEIPRDEEGEPLYEDFICKACSEVCFFLNLYPETIWAVGKQSDATVKVSKDKGVVEDNPSTCGSEKPIGDSSSNNNPEIDDAKATVDSESVSAGKSMLLDGNCDDSLTLNHCTGSSKKHVDCLLAVNIVAASPVLHGKPMFLSKSWRDTLCKCNNCLEFYNQKRIAFLLDKEDSIAEYEKMAKQKREEKLQQQQGAELSFFNKLGHVEKVEILKGIEEMKDGLRAFLESADASKPITADDVHQFFDDIKNKRRRVQ